MQSLSGTTPPSDLPSLRQVRSEFPGFEIWREVAVDRTRFIARARDLVWGVIPCERVGGGRRHREWTAAGEAWAG